MIDQVEGRWEGEENKGDLIFSYLVGETLVGQVVKDNNEGVWGGYFYNPRGLGRFMGNVKTVKEGKEKVVKAYEEYRKEYRKSIS